MIISQRKDILELISNAMATKSSVEIEKAYLRVLDVLENE